MYKGKQCSLANDGILRHDVEMLSSYNVTITSGGHKQVRAWGCVFHSSNFIASHRGLKGVDGIDLSDNHTGAVRTE